VIVGRFAPSPTGELHLGSAAAALFTAARAKAQGGALVLRVEDLDHARRVEGSTACILRDLAWLGVEWHEGPDVGGPVGPYVQSARLALYEAALSVLASQGSAYLCDCSRAEVARASSAPHVGDEGPMYPGTCRRWGMAPRAFKRPPAVRLDTSRAGLVHWLDAHEGPHVCDVEATLGDFVLRRGDGAFAYQLACAVDDLAMGITEVVRGADLATSAPRQALLFRLLGSPPPSYLHVPLVLGPEGDRLAKRAPRMTLREQRELGTRPADLCRRLTSGYGAELESGTVDELAGALLRHRWPRSAQRVAP